MNLNQTPYGVYPQQPGMYMEPPCADPVELEQKADRKSVV